jgi:hypothetical protein
MVANFGDHALYFETRTKLKFKKLFIDGLGKPLSAVALMGAIEEPVLKMKERWAKMGKPPSEWNFDFNGPVIDILKKHIPEMEDLAADLEHEFQLILGVKKAE